MMRRFFISLFVLSLIATAGAYYWRTYQPEVAVSVEPGARTFSPGDQEAGPEARSSRVERVPSDRQDLAVTISIWSSVISAIAAILQTWLTARAVRR